jgi:hypothetical protein
VDISLGYISIAYGAGTYTLPADWDRRPFSTSGTPKTVFGNTFAFGSQTPLTTSYQKWADAVLTGLSPSVTYDGKLKFLVTFPTSLSDGQLYQVALDTATGPGLWNKGDVNMFIDVSHHSFVFEWPIYGVTGLTTLTIPIRFKNAQAGTNFYMTPIGWWFIELWPRT